MKIIKNKVSLKELKQIAGQTFGNLVKAVVDIKKDLMVIDAELHADEEALLLKQGSQQKDLWGINLYPELEKKDRIEFGSIINIRPNQDNFAREIEDKKIREKIRRIVDQLIE